MSEAAQMPHEEMPPPDRGPRRGRSQRLFVALYPPPEVAESLLAELLQIDPPLPDPHRTTPLAQVHGTVLFLGDRPAGATGGILETIKHAVHGIQPFTLTPQRITRLPQQGKTRTIVVETDRPAPLLDLHERLVQRLVERPRSDARNRYLPHLTIARLSPPGTMWDVDRPLDMPGFNVEQISLVRSLLLPEGAQHRPLETIQLDSC